MAVSGDSHDDLHDPILVSASDELTIAFDQYRYCFLDFECSL